MPRIYDTMSFPSYVYSEYPKMLYGEKGKTITVESEEAEKELAGKWWTKPGDVGKVSDGKTP